MKRDHGFAWVVLAASFLCNVLVCAVYIGPALMLIDLTHSFNIAMSTAGWINSINTFVSCLVAVLNGVMIEKFSCRSVGIFGAVTGAFVLLLCSQMQNVIAFTIFYCFIYGVFISFSRLSSIVIIQMYFAKKRPFATGIAASGFSVGVFAFMPLVAYCIDVYGWRGALMITAGLAFNKCAFMMLYFPFTAKPSQSDKDEKPNKENDTNNDTNTNTVKFSYILRNPVFLLLAIALTLFHFTADLCFKISASRAELDMGVPIVKASALSSAISIGGLVSRVLSSFIVNLPFVNRTAMFAFSILIGGIIVIISAFITHYTASLGLAVAYGLMFGMSTAVETTVLVDLLGLNAIAKTQGLIHTIIGFGYLLNMPFAGAMFDVFQSFKMAYIIAGGLQVTAGLTSIVVLIKMKKMKDSYSEQISTGNIQAGVKKLADLKKESIMIGSIESLTVQT